MKIIALNQKLFLVITFLSSCMALAGGMEGGGGGGVRCFAPNGSSTLETLDLHEGRLRGLNYQYAPNSDSEIADLVATVGTNHYWNPFWGISKANYVDRLKTSAIYPLLNGQSFVEPFYNQAISVVRVNQLPLSNDYGTYTIRPGCSLEQVAYFDDSKKTLFIASNWSELDGLNKSALLVHEIAFFENRKEGLEYAGTGVGGTISSERSRQFVSSLLSTSGLMPRYYGLASGNYSVCTSYNSQDTSNFFLFNSSSTDVTAVFRSVADRYSEYATRATFSNIQIQELLDPKSGPMNFNVTLDLNGEVDPPSITVHLNKDGNGTIMISYTRNLGGTEVPISSPEKVDCN